jgi:hypothetical protein
MDREPGWISRATSDGEAGPPSLLAAVGGWLGIAEATLPFLAFTIVWTATGQDILIGGIVAVGISAVLALARLLRRQTTQFALSGVIGVAFGAFVASRTGNAEDFFLPGILINAGSATVYLISIAVRRPLIGLLVSTVTGEGQAWYSDPERRSAYTKASWIWVGLFCFRLSIQLPLYLSGLVGPLAVARVITGIPLFALGVWLSYQLLRNSLPELEGETETETSAS